MTPLMQRKSHTLFAFVLTANLLTAAGTWAEDTQPGKQNLRETPVVKAVRKAKPSVVTLKVTRRSAYSSREVFGTGVVVDESGIVVTNRHVVAGAEGVKAMLFDGSEHTAQVLVEDARHDLAILKLPGKMKLTKIR